MGKSGSELLLQIVAFSLSFWNTLMWLPVYLSTPRVCVSYPTFETGYRTTAFEAWIFFLQFSFSCVQQCITVIVCMLQLFWVIFPSAIVVIIQIVRRKTGLHIPWPVTMIQQMDWNLECIVTNKHWKFDGNRITLL